MVAVLETPCVYVFDKTAYVDPTNMTDANIVCFNLWTEINDCRNQEQPRSFLHSATE